ncbi:hypothetical protein [Sporosarcina sp. P17b]|uniref:hypothetical protein n=1 Tax=Sporosarcina sp. P17b TaxID=2048260 RepID=UPI000C162BC9|nr:hypothetical protein [Sporosarcina sp. P17b]PIC75040.1 hypothetical protein CSV76_00060 [Sporosarcina sp. P17b]
MNQSTLSESFGQQIKDLTAGTIYEVQPDEIDSPDKTMDQEEARIRSVMYNLWMGAQSKHLAKRMKDRQAAHYEQLYEFSYGVVSYDPEDRMVKGTENIALMIIDEKRAFAKRIANLYAEHDTFRSIMASLDEPSRRILTQYFMHHNKVDYETLRQALKKNLNKIEKVFKSDEQRKEDRADREEEEEQAALGRVPVMVGRVKVFMSKEEHQRHIEEQRALSEDLMTRLGLK